MTTYNAATVTYDQSSLTYQGLPAQFDGVAFAVEVAFGYAPLDTEPSWEAVTPYVRDIRIDRGRRSEWIQASPGKLGLTLDNRTRRFDPEYTSGPYYGDLVPMVPVRVQVTYDGTTWTLFTGFVEGWPTVYNTSNTDAETRVTAVDGSRLLRQYVLPRTMLEATVADTSPTHYWPLTNPTTGVVYDTVRDYKVEPFLYATSNPTAYTSDMAAGDPTIMAGLTGTNGTGLASLDTYTGPLRSVMFVTDATAVNTDTTYTGGRVLFTNSTNDGIDVSFGDGDVSVTYSNVTDNRYYPATLVTAPYTRDRGNMVVLTFDTSNVRVYVNGSLVHTGALSTGTTSLIGLLKSRVYFKAYGSIGQVAIWDYTLSDSDVATLAATAAGYDGDTTGTRLGRLLNLTAWPATWRTIATGDQTLGPYYTDGVSVLTAAQLIGTAEIGYAFINSDGNIELKDATDTATANIVALFDDEGIDAPFTDIEVSANTVDDIVNTVEAVYQYGSVTVSDSASVTAYGEATSRVDARLVNTPTVATTIAQNVVDRAKNPRTRVNRLDIPVRRDPATIVPMVAPLDLADDVTVSFTPTGVGDPLWRAVRVQGIRHNISLNDWRVSLYLAPGPVNTNGPLMVLDDDTYGKLDSGNKLG